MGRGVRARTTILAVAVIGGAAVIASIVLVVLLRQSMVRGIDAHATLWLQDVATLARRGSLPPTLAGTDEDGTLAQVVVDGHVVTQSPLIHGGQPLARFVPPRTSMTVRTVSHLPVNGGSTYRVAATRVDTPRGAGVVYAAASVEPVSDSIHTLKLLLLFVVPGLILLVGGTTWWLVGRSLEPVEAIRRQVAAISGTELARRVPEPPTGDEIQRLAGTMNGMLDRLEHAMDRQRTFVSDAAHELRSPLAAMRVELEVAAAHPDRADTHDVVLQLAADVRRMERLVEDLLVLASAEEQRLVRRSEVDLDELVLRQVAPLRSASRVHVDLHRVAGARVIGDGDQLERVVANLLDNAERHAATTVAIEVQTTDGWAEVVIADDGPGIPREARERVFDRFARVDFARDRGAGGAGLGLAIARRIVESHGGDIAIGDPRRGTRMIVRLPVAGADNGTNRAQRSDTESAMHPDDYDDGSGCVRGTGGRQR